MSARGPFTLAVGAVRFGGPEVLEVVTRAMPEPAPDEVIVRVCAATVNPTDTLLRSGAKRNSIAATAPPYVAGMEFAGTVHALGSASLPFELGQPVMGIVSPYRAEGGAQVRHLRVASSSLVSAPADMDFVSAATIPMNGLTAKVALELLNLEPGQSVLVTGAAGAVGGYVVELASRAGLHVIAVAASLDECLVRRLGAVEVLPRGTNLHAAIRKVGVAEVAGAVDAALIGSEVEDLVVQGGAYVALRGSSTSVSESRVRRTGVSVLEHAHDNAALMWVRDRAAQGELTPRVARTFAMRDAGDAHRLLEAGGLRGRPVLRLDGPDET